ncbi:hypothetical protein HMPREF9069_01059 [Atopobium sp. oral taxon 810 str. F0209]|nr:hypothetical protein HMPREF9069_01059 [Atopobium sp. oral taxon 810 str. F0209]
MYICRDLAFVIVQAKVYALHVRSLIGADKFDLLEVALLLPGYLSLRLGELIFGHKIRHADGREKFERTLASIVCIVHSGLPSKPSSSDVTKSK